MNESGASHEHLIVLNAALRVAAKHPSLLAPAAFKELVQVISRHLPIAGLIALVPDGDEYQRIYVDVSSPTAMPPLGSGSRIPMLPHFVESIYKQGRPYTCDDARVGSELAQLAAAVGFLSFVVVPIKSAESERAAGGLAWLFREVGEASRAPIDLLVAVGEVVGLGFESALRFARKRRLAMILETSSDAMLAWDLNGRVTDANDAALAITGLSREELLGRDIGLILEPRPEKKRARFAAARCADCAFGEGKQWSGATTFGCGNDYCGRR